MYGSIIIYENLVAFHIIWLAREKQLDIK